MSLLSGLRCGTYEVLAAAPGSVLEELREGASLRGVDRLVLGTFVATVIAALLIAPVVPSP